VTRAKDVVAYSAAELALTRTALRTLIDQLDRNQTAMAGQVRDLLAKLNSLRPQFGAVPAAAAKASLTSPYLVVGIDGSGTSWLAFDWAVDEAERTNRGLVVVHAAPDPDDSYGEELMSDAIDRLAEEHAELHSEGMLVIGPSVTALLAVGTEADLIVLGGGPVRDGERASLGASAREVLRLASCPVVVVKSPGDPARRNLVVAGVSTTEDGLATMRTACELARRRNASVLAVRSWVDRPWKLLEPLTPPTGETSIRDREKRVLGEWIDLARGQFPDVPIESELSEAPAHLVLEARSAEAALVVLGIRRTPMQPAAHLGPITEWLLANAKCPVVVVRALAASA
jgi:nucleotide-binding universal stress UspA family protein